MKTLRDFAVDTAVMAALLWLIMSCYGCLAEPMPAVQYEACGVWVE
jgi:hypothetical protein